MLPVFKYEEPVELQQAIKLLTNDHGSRIIAGGSDLLVKMKNKITKPGRLVSLQHLPELNLLHYDGFELQLGAMCTINSIASSEIIKREFVALAEAAGKLGSMQIRNIATVGGNLCNAAPSAETASPLLVFDATARISGIEGERTLKLSEFFKGPSETVLNGNEILTGITVPKLPERSASRYLKFGLRNGMDIAVVGVAVALTLDEELKKCVGVRLGLGAVAPVPVRGRSVEERLMTEPVSQKKIEQISEFVVQDIAPISDIRASAEYRKDLAKVLTARALTMAWNDILRHENRTSGLC